MAERIADFIPPPVWNYWASSSSGTVEAYKEFVAFCLDCLIQKKNVETELAKRLALSEPSDKR